MYSIKDLSRVIAISAVSLLSAGFVGTVSAVEIGGYGELHYNNVPSSGENGDEQIDFHRFVLFFGHEFSDNIRFFSEVELEHSLAGEGKPGEVELEQAFIQFQTSKATTVSAGLFLVPVGILNETHEPPTFYGVERNPVEKRIIPTTWWEAGVMLSGALPEQGVSYDIAYHSGLDAAGANIRSGRQKVAEAEAENKAMTARLRYKGIAGIELAASLQYQEDLDQVEGGAEDAILFQTHAIININNFGARALYAIWDINGDVGASYLSEQTGYYLEASYKLASQWGVFARHSELNYRRSAGLELDEQQQNLGVNYWPHEDVVVKADIQQQNDDAGDGDGFNLGIGYQF